MNWKNLFKGETNVLKTLIRTEDNRLVWETMETMKGCAVNHDKMEAYVMDAENMVMRKSTGELIQILAERSASPVAIRKATREVTKETKNAIGKETISQELQRIDKRNAKESFANKIMLLVAIPCVTVLIVVAVNLADGRLF